jgi:membrane associated rhomboid family serine protease
MVRSHICTEGDLRLTNPLAMLTGSPIMVHPQFNPMIGPSTYVLINTGARFVPCMRTIPQVENSAVPISWPCPNTTSSDPTNPSNHCDLAALCGFSATNSAASFDQHPDQWFRFIVPMFLHAGIVHIGFNMLLQLTMGREMELAIGSVRFALVYFSSGIFGFVLGGNFAATAIASTGASGCLFGILALTLLDLIYCWKERPSPVKDLMWILADVLVSFVLGLLPGLDNFSHIGGFLMGLALGICILHSPNPLRERIGLTPVPYSPMPTDPKRPTTAVADPLGNFAKQPVGFFKGRKPLWWGWWLLRAGALIGVLIGFVVLLNNFYKYRDTCSWCKYLSCLPINNWCNIGNLQLSNTTTNNKLRRDLMFGADELGAGLAKSLWEIGPM